MSKQTKLKYINLGDIDLHRGVVNNTNTTFFAETVRFLMNSNVDILDNRLKLNLYLKLMDYSYTIGFPPQR